MRVVLQLYYAAHTRRAAAAETVFMTVMLQLKCVAAQVCRTRRVAAAVVTLVLPHYCFAQPALFSQFSE